MADPTGTFAGERILAGDGGFAGDDGSGFVVVLVVTDGRLCSSGGERTSTPLWVGPTFATSLSTTCVLIKGREKMGRAGESPIPDILGILATFLGLIFGEFSSPLGLAAILLL